MRNPALILACCAACAVLVASAEAAPITANGTPSFNLTLNGVDQAPTYTLPVSAIDARGLSTGGGWNLTVTSTQFNDGSGHTFPTAASTITNVATACGTGSTCTLPTNSVSNTNLGLPAASTAPAAVKFVNAATATGLGTMNVNATVSVAVPANVFAGTYSSTV